NTVEQNTTTTEQNANIDALVDALKKDGMAQGDDVKVQIVNGKISVNGKLLTDEETKKYASFIK
ncbi:MAG: hypothetical protein ACOVNY_00070, partial [Chitinophagaceae bacterium]